LPPARVGQVAARPRRAPIDYQHYIERQLQPVAGAIRPFVQDNFTKLIDPNPSLF
jgi:DNA polymerase-2